jgi:membrane associated rhomboid family serine protease
MTDDRPKGNDEEGVSSPPLGEHAIITPVEGASFGDGPPKQRQAALNLPPLLTIILVALLAIFLIDNYILTNSMRSLLLFELAFTPLRYVYPLADQGLEWLWTPVTYSLLHGSVEHQLFNGLWLAAFGAPVLRRVGMGRFLLFWALSSAAAAFFHAGLHWGQETLLIGASGVISALMGAACRFAFPDGGFSIGRMHAHRLPRQGIFKALGNRTVLIFVLLWLFGNVLIAVGISPIGGGPDSIAWDAHIGGFLMGFFGFRLFDRRNA